MSGRDGRRRLFAWGCALAALASGCGTAMPMLSATPAVASRGTLPAAPPGGFPGLDEPYPLLPGDRIRVDVRDDPDLACDYTIESDGAIEVWKSDVDGKERERLPVRGLTLVQVKEAVTLLYQRTRFTAGYRPFVQVSLVSAVTRVVYIRGALSVGSGTLDLPRTGRMTLWRAIQAAGARSEDADLSRVMISRRDPATGEEVSLPTYDLEEMELSANYDRDPPLEPNDIITVPRLGKVHVFGNINSTGAYLCRKGLTMLSLIAEAGGLKPFSKIHDVRVIRNEGTGREKYYRVDVGAIIDGKAPYDPLLAPGDRIWIDEDWK